MVISIPDAIKELKAMNAEDEEREHSRADAILCEVLKSLGYHELVEAYEAVDKWYA